MEQYDYMMPLATGDSEDTIRPVQNYNYFVQDFIKYQIKIYESKKQTVFIGNLNDGNYFISVIKFVTDRKYEWDYDDVSISNGYPVKVYDCYTIEELIAVLELEFTYLQNTIPELLELVVPESEIVMHYITQ